MPYIEQGDRDRIENMMSNLSEPYDLGHSCDTCGEINYIITSIISGYLANNSLSYARINEVIGILECAKQELYRKVAVPYEDLKCSANGEVY